MAVEIIMPRLGESVVEGTLVRWLVKEGDHVEEFDSLMEVESAKVNTELPSPATGTLLKILVEEGTTVQAGKTLGWIGDPGEKIPEGSSGKGREPSVDQVHESPIKIDLETTENSAVQQKDLGFISPVVAKLAREHHVDLSLVKGTGNNNRITKNDVLEFVNQKGKAEPELAAWETPGEGDLFRPTELQFPERFKSDYPDIQRKKEPETHINKTVQSEIGDQILPLSKMRKAIAAHMVLSKQTSPHVTSVMEADMKSVSDHLSKNKELFARQGVRLTYTAYFVAATASALREFPLVNSSWTDEGLLLKSMVNIGLATSLEEEGLIVPVIKAADSYSLSGLAGVIGDLVSKARNHQLKPDDVQGGTFSITNHGTAGSLFATPVINQPQAGILGIGMIKKRVVVIEDAIAIRPMVYLSLAFDHRILDGSTADNFLANVVQKLENWQ